MEKVFDPLRKIEVALTPEEKVRQDVIRWLNQKLRIPMVMMASEYSFRYNGLTYRADIVVFGRDTKPLMLVECKAPSVKIDEDVVGQGVRYNRVLGVKYMMFVNGVKMCFFEREGDTGQYKMLPGIPKIEIK